MRFLSVVDILFSLQILCKMMLIVLLRGMLVKKDLTSKDINL